MKSNFKAKHFNFRGVKKEEIQRQNESQIQCMTVGLIRLYSIPNFIPYISAIRRRQNVNGINVYISVADKRTVRRSVARDITLHWDGEKLFKPREYNRIRPKSI